MGKYIGFFCTYISYIFKYEPLVTPSATVVISVATVVTSVATVVNPVAIIFPLSVPLLFGIQPLTGSQYWSSEQLHGIVHKRPK